jgi:signal transduction histidine kinase
MRVDDLRALSIFDGLSDDQLAELVAGGTEVRIEPGVELFREGEPADFWWVLVDGAIELLRRTGREDTVVARMDLPGRWAGGFRAWDEHGTYLATGRGVLAGRVLRVPSAVLRERSNSWFPFAAHLIEGLYRTARSIESTARQRASLITLGTLAAGIAHEVNNPASAATRAVDALESTMQVLLTSVGRLARDEVPVERLAALDELRRQIGPAVPESDPLARADREQALATWLSRRGVVHAWSIAPSLAAAGVTVDWCARVATVLGPAALEPGFEWLASTFSMATLLAELKESTRRITELVAAVRSYTQLDRASLQQVDIADGLDSTLVMLGHKLRGVTVVRDYGEGVPKVEAFAGELNQVWTNLIDNAVDAMEGKGTLRVATRVEEGNVVVEIGDTGSGMTSEVAARAFEAFFTTKDVGKGLGLGLDIARRIVVERHGGTIMIDSRPGETVFRVGIPLRPAVSGRR